MAMLPIIVKIGTLPNGRAKYPNFNLLATVQASGLDWSKYIDAFGSGWLYDEIGHKDDDDDSPRDQQWGMILVPQLFATEAVAQFPTEVAVIDEVEASDFYNKRVAVRQPEQVIDTDIVHGIKLKQDLGIPLTPDQVDALDPTKKTRGIVNNDMRLYADFKAKFRYQLEPVIVPSRPRRTWRRAQ